MEQNVAAANESVYRVRLHRPAAGVGDLQVRSVLRRPRGRGRPHVFVWNELGDELDALRTTRPGTRPAVRRTRSSCRWRGADYLEFSAPGDGSQLRAVFLTWLQKSEIVSSRRILPRRIRVKEPFQILVDYPHQARMTAISVRRGDRAAAGRQSDRAQTGGCAGDDVRVPTGAPAARGGGDLRGARRHAWAQPRRWRSTRRHRSPPRSTCLTSPIPATAGETRDGDSHMGFRYTGWVHAQKVIQGEDLAAGLNNLTIALSKGSDTVAIRSVQIQLKYNWEKLDYILTSARTDLPPASNDSP